MQLNILHIMQSLEVGGMENGVVNIVNAIDKKFTSKIYCTKRIGNLAKKLNDQSLIVYGGEYKGIFKSTLSLLKYCYKERPDILHSHGWGTLISAYIVSKLLRIKLVHGEHGTVYFESRRNTLVQKYMLNRTDLNLYVSKSLLKLFSETLGITGSNRVIYNGVDTERFKPLDIISEKARSVVLLGTVGRLVPVKNQIWLVEALSEVLSDKVHLMLVGSGPLEQDLLDKVKEIGMEDKVIVYGESSSPERVMNDFDIFILPSLSEGLSNTILEAMAVALPILASNVGGNSELVVNGGNGLLFELNNKNDFLSKLNSLIADKEKCKHFSEESLVIVEKEFKIGSMIVNYQNAYLDVVR